MMYRDSQFFFSWCVNRSFKWKNIWFARCSFQEAEGNGSGRSPKTTRSRAGDLTGVGVGGGGAGAGGSGSVSVELTSLAAGYLVSLLKEPEVSQELWPLIARCMDNIVARRSVPSSLEVLRRAIATLPAHEAKSWFGASKSKENRCVSLCECFFIIAYSCGRRLC